MENDNGLWGKFRFLIVNAKNVLILAISGFLVWMLLILGLESFGVMSVEAQCGQCGVYFDRLFEVLLYLIQKFADGLAGMLSNPANAATLSPSVVIPTEAAPWHVVVKFFPLD